MVVCRCNYRQSCQFWTLEIRYMTTLTVVVLYTSSRLSEMNRKVYGGRSVVSPAFANSLYALLVRA